MAVEWKKLAYENHVHDGDTLQIDGINSDGGAFSFTTSGTVSFSQSIIVPNAGYIGSVSDPDAIQIDDTGNVVFSQRVGIGAAEDASIQLKVYHATNNGLLLLESGDPIVILYMRDDTTSGNGFALARSGDNLSFYTGDDTERMTIESTGEITLKAGQLNFPNSQNASADANTLDDYEEGTFTITATPATSGTVTMDSGFDLCSYVKIGKIVHVQGTIKVDSVSSPVGYIRFSLPFTADNLSEFAAYAAGSVRASGVDYGADYLIAYLEENTTYFLIAEIIDNAGADYYDGNDVAAGDYFTFQLTYRASA